VIACAGGGERTSVEGFSADHVDRVLAMNLTGTVHCIEAVLPDMLARGDGHIVAISSLAASRGLPGGAAYGAAKAALSNLMESLRMELRGRGVAVTLICPGFVRTKPSAKKKMKPFQVDLEKATAVMCSAVVNRVRYCAFPRGLTLVVRMASLLPAALYDRLLMIAGSRRKPVM
jgi:short-subunit dehydrogenase